jgi:hypothetical protein
MTSEQVDAPRNSQPVDLLKRARDEFVDEVNMQQQVTKPFNLWPIFGCVVFLLALMLFQNALPISQALHEQAEVGIALFSFGMLHMVGGELVASIKEYRRSRRK